MARSALHPRRRARHHAVLGGVLAAGALAGAAAVAEDAKAFTLNQKDAQFVLDQILVAENGSVIGPGPNQILDPTFPRGLRTVDGTNNNLVNAAQQGFGAADLPFPRLLTPLFRDAEVIPAGFPGAGSATSYAQTGGTVADSQPRTISNLIVDQTASNPVATLASTAAGGSIVDDGDPATPNPYFIPNANNDLVSGAPAISDTTPAIGQTLTATKGSIADLDGTPADSAISYQWQVSAGTGWAPADSGPTFTPDALYAGRQIRVIATFTDNHGTTEARTSAPTAALPGVAVVLPGSAPAPVLTQAGGPATPPPAPPPAALTLTIKSFKIVTTGAKKPFTVSFVLNAPATVGFEVRRLNGAIVRRITHKNKNGKVTLKWNKLDSKGRRVLPGRFRITIVVTSNGVSQTLSRVVRIR